MPALFIAMLYASTWSRSLFVSSKVQQHPMYSLGSTFASYAASSDTVLQVLELAGNGVKEPALVRGP